MKLFKKGFTLGEMLICLGIISVVVAMMIPAVMSKKPGKNKALLRKAYYNTERVVYDLVNNEDENFGFPGTKVSQYSAGTDKSTAFAYFNNSVSVKITRGVNPVSTKRTQAATGRYLCSQLAAKMNTSGYVDCYNDHTMPADGTRMSADTTAVGSGDTPSFVTNDGVAWYLSPSNAVCIKGRANCASTSQITINVDVNGESAPNTTEGNDPDRFSFSFDPEGKMTVPVGSKAARYLKTNTIYKD